MQSFFVFNYGGGGDKAIVKLRELRGMIYNTALGRKLVMDVVYFSLLAFCLVGGRLP